MKSHQKCKPGTVHFSFAFTTSQPDGLHLSRPWQHFLLTWAGVPLKATATRRNCRDKRKLERFDDDQALEFAVAHCKLKEFFLDKSI
jgi:hypothetical protein